MKSELSFLIELLLNADVPANIKPILAERISQIEQNYQTPKIVYPSHAMSTNQVGNQQAPSMQRIMEQNPDITPPIMAATPVAQAALARRDAIMKAAENQKPEPGRTSPRKF